MSKKLFAVIAMMLMIFSPLAVLGCTEAAAGAETNEDGTFTLDDIIGKNNYWVKATESGNTLTLENISETKGGVLELKTTNSKYTTVKINEGFTIPYGKGIISQPASTDTSLVLTVNNDFSVEGSISGPIFVETGKNITFTNVTIGPDCRIEMQGNNKLMFQSRCTINGLDLHGHHMSYFGISMKHVSTENLTIVYPEQETNVKNTWSISGYIDGNGLTSFVKLGDNDNPDSNTEAYFLNDLEMDTLNFMLTYKPIDSIVVSSSFDTIDYRGCDTFCDDVKALGLIKSQDEGKEYLMLLNYCYDVTDEGTIVECAVNHTGTTAYYAVLAVGTEGIKSVGSPLTAVNIYQNVIDLTKINVTCEDGYKFHGWFYADDNGVLCKIADPSKVTITQNMKVYAVAEKVIPDIPSYPEQKDYNNLLIGLIVIGVLILLLGVAAFYMRFVKKA